MKFNHRTALFSGLLFVNFIYFISSMHLTCSNDGSHFALVSAIMETGGVKIDNFINYTGMIDYCVKDGAYYSDRPPGLALMSIPFYAVGKLLCDMQLAHFFGDTDNICAVFVLFLPNLAGTFSFLLMFWLCQFFKFDFKTSIFSSLLFAFATPAWIESSRFFSHGVSMALVFGAAYLVIVLKKFDFANIKTIIGIGILLSLSSITEIQNIFFAGIFFVYLLAIKKIEVTRILKRESLTCLGLSITVFALIYAVLPLYNFAAFHEFTVKSNIYNPAFPDERSFSTALSGNILVGIDKLFTNFLNSEIIFHWDKGVQNNTPGLLVLCPIMLLSLVGFVYFFKSNICEAFLFLAMILVEVMVCSLHKGALTRHVTTILPFLFFPVAFLIDKAFELTKIKEGLLKRYGLMVLIFFLGGISVARVFYVLNTTNGRSLGTSFIYLYQWRSYLFFYGFLFILYSIFNFLKERVHTSFSSRSN